MSTLAYPLYLYRRGHRAVLDLNTWLAAAAEDAEGHDQDAAPSASATTLDSARLDLDPPGFSCKTFQDLTVWPLRVVGNIARIFVDVAAGVDVVRPERYTDNRTRTAAVGEMMESFARCQPLAFCTTN